MEKPVICPFCGKVLPESEETQAEKIAPKEKEERRDEQFEAFWAIYPRKAGKAEARRAWLRLRPDAALRAKIASAIEAAKQSDQWRRSNGKYIPYPATWLNRGQWDDEIEPKGGKGDGKEKKGGGAAERGTDGRSEFDGFKNALK
jgi:sarcosine oxidase delta subunit